MSDAKVTLGLIGFFLIIGLLISSGVHEIIGEVFEVLQPDENSNFQTPFSSETFSFIFIVGIALIFALKIMQE